MKIVVVGGSGLVGSWVTQMALTNDFIKEIHILTRTINISKKDKIHYHLINFDQISKADFAIFENAHAVISAIGTTRKKTANLDAYRAIDHGINIKIAQIAKEKNVAQFHIISAMGANPESKIFYNQLKGEIERDLINLSFSQLFIYRPSLLMGKRNEKRFGERLAQILFPCVDFLFLGPMKKYQSVTAKDLAKATIKNLKNQARGYFILDKKDF